MAILQIDRNPPSRQLRSFGALLALFVLLFGAFWWWRTGRPETARLIWVAGGFLAALYWAVPAVRRPIYVGWMFAVFPIGWTTSHLLMALVYYGVITPIGMLVRWNGPDLLQRRFDRSADSYWTSRPPPPEVSRYFKQY
jgi:protein-S-isoprenylcysteine O-methyltransferase Ste14